jgi:protein-tyrosine phosphatase/arsenate reductase
MNTKLTQFSEEITLQFDQIPADRKLVLDRLTTYIHGNQNSGKESLLMFICTHNSRRSHFGQVMCAFAAAYYGISNVHTYSAGTEETAFHPHAIEALQTIGFKIEQLDQRVNPQYRIHVSESVHSDCFSKTISHESLPKNHFAAIMTCSDAEQNCPFVIGADFRIGLSFEDPKAFDGTAQESEMYLARVHQIAREIFYVFSRLTN